MIEEILDEWIANRDEIIVGIMKNMLETDYMIDDVFDRFSRIQKNCKE